MYVSPEFVFLHVPKTGGRFLRTVCERHFGPSLVNPEDLDTRGDPVHAGVRDIPAEFQSLPRFSLVRNPWDWYVSWYFYNREDEVARARARTMLEVDFRSFVLESFRLRPYRQHGMYLAFLIGTLGPIREPQAEIGRMESLAVDFEAFLGRNRIEAPPGLDEALRGRRINVSDHHEYRTYYDAELRDNRDRMPPPDPALRL